MKNLNVLSKSIRTRASVPLALCLSTVGLLGCAAEADDEVNGDIDTNDELSLRKDELFLEGTKWTGGTVPVCWTSASQARGTFATESAMVRRRVNQNWAAVAKINFTEWGSCPSP
jgi:hypothetical protein